MNKLFALLPIVVGLSACGGDSFDHAGACTQKVEKDLKNRAIKIALRDRMLKAKAKTEKYKMEPLEGITISGDTLDDMNRMVLKHAKDRRWRAQTPRVRKVIREVKAWGGEPSNVYIAYNEYKSIIGEWPWFFSNVCVSWKNAKENYQVISSTIQERSKNPR